MIILNRVNDIYEYIRFFLENLDPQKKLSTFGIRKQMYERSTSY